MCEDTNNHVYKLATDNLQLVLIKVLITSIKVSQGSVATCLMYGVIFNEHFVYAITAESDS